MAAVAAFASSPAGQLYARTCKWWGTDPAAGFGDDVLAYNLRAALMLGTVMDSKPVNDAEAAAKAFEQEWLSLG